MAHTEEQYIEVLRNEIAMLRNQVIDLRNACEDALKFQNKDPQLVRDILKIAIENTKIR